MGKKGGVAKTEREESMKGVGLLYQIRNVSILVPPPILLNLSVKFHLYKENYGYFLLLRVFFFST